MKKFILIALLGLAACGGSEFEEWTGADSNAAETQLQQEAEGIIDLDDLDLQARPKGGRGSRSCSVASISCDRGNYGFEIFAGCSITCPAGQTPSCSHTAFAFTAIA